MFEIVGALALALSLCLLVRRWPKGVRDHDAGRSRTPAALGGRVLVAVSNPASGQALGDLATAMARVDDGHVAALAVLGPGDGNDIRSLSRETTRRCGAVATEGGVSASSRLRVDTSVAAGVLHQAVESDASLVVLGWPRLGPGGRPAPAVADAIAGVPCPLLLTRLQGYQRRRIVLRVPVSPIAQGLQASLRLATDVAERLADQHHLPVVCVPVAERVPEDPSQLIVVPVAPTDEALDRALRETAPLGDVVLALCHGTRATERRELLTTAAGLYGPSTP